MSNNTCMPQRRLGHSNQSAMPERGSVVPVRRKLVLWHQRSKQRQALSKLDEASLEDMGISPDQAIFESEKYFWQE